MSIGSPPVSGNFVVYIQICEPSGKTRGANVAAWAVAEAEARNRQAMPAAISERSMYFICAAEHKVARRSNASDLT